MEEIEIFTALAKWTKERIDEGDFITPLLILSLFTFHYLDKHKLFKHFFLKRKTESDYIDKLNDEHKLHDEFMQKTTQLLYNFREKYNLSNILYCELHNGGKNYFGISYRKFSQRSQFPRLNTPYLHIKDEGIGSMTTLLNELKNDKFVRINVTDERVYEKHFFLNKLNETHSNYCIIYPLFFKNKMIVSFIVLFYDNESKELNSSENKGLQFELMNLINQFYETANIKRKTT